MRPSLFTGKNVVTFVFLAQVFATFAMTGLIWFVQVVHYPLFALIPDAQHSRYAARHQTLTGWVVGPLMLVELAASLLPLWPAWRPVFVGATGAVLGFVLVGLIWVSTGLVQVPLHERLLSGLDKRAIRRLVVTNWIRTVAWSLRCGLLMFWLLRMV